MISPEELAYITGQLTKAEYDEVMRKKHIVETMAQEERQLDREAQRGLDRWLS